MQDPAAFAIDIQEAQHFLDVLAGAPNATFTFQTYADDREASQERKRELAHTITGRFSECANRLIQLNRAGASICVAVNPQIGKVRSDANTICPRACWHENDDALVGSLLYKWPVAPSIIVETRPGHQHFYWIINRPAGAASPAEWAQWYGVGRHLISKLLSDPRCLKRSQVLRIPGFFWAKDPTSPNRVRIVRESGLRYELATLARAFPAPEPIEETALALAHQTTDSERDTELQLVSDQSFAELTAALDYINPDQSRAVWINVLMALEWTRHPDRRNVADNWSQTGGLKDQKHPFTGDASTHVHSKYLPGEPEAMMRSFCERADKLVKPGTIIALARQNGWQGGTDSFEAMLGTDSKPDDNPDIFTVESYAEMQAVEWPERRWLVDGMVPGDATTTILTGEPGTGKSYMALALAFAGASGTRFAGASVAPTLPAFGTAYIDLGENGRDISYRRIKAIHERTAYENPHAREAIEAARSRVINIWTPRLVYPLVEERYGLVVANAKRIGTIREMLLRVQEKIDVELGCVVIDNMPKLSLANENSTAVALSIIDAVSNAVFPSFPRAGIVMVAHSRKSDTTTGASDRTGGSVRGASAFVGAVRSVMLLRRTTPKESKRMGLTVPERREWRYLVSDKLNFAKEFDPLLLHFERGCWWHRDIQPMSETDRQYAAFRSVVVAFLSHPTRAALSTSLTAVIGRRNRGPDQPGIAPLGVIDPCDDDGGILTQQEMAAFAERAFDDGWLLRERSGNEHTIKLHPQSLLI